MSSKQELQMTIYAGDITVANCTTSGCRLYCTTPTQIERGLCVEHNKSYNPSALSPALKAAVAESSAAANCTKKDEKAARANKVIAKNVLRTQRSSAYGKGEQIEKNGKYLAAVTKKVIAKAGVKRHSHQVAADHSVSTGKGKGKDMRSADRSASSSRFASEDVRETRQTKAAKANEAALSPASSAAANFRGLNLEDPDEEMAEHLDHEYPNEEATEDFDENFDDEAAEDHEKYAADEAAEDHEEYAADEAAQQGSGNISDYGDDEEI